MSWVKFICGLNGVLLVFVSAGAQERAAALLPAGPSKAATPLVLVAQQPEKKGDKEKKQDKTAEPKIEFTRPEVEPGEATRGPRPNMIADLPPVSYALVFVPIPSLAKLKIPPIRNGGGQTIDIPFTGQRAVRVPVAGPGGFKIAENESPFPQDRVFFTYNYYDNVQGPAQGSDRALLLSQMVNFRGQDFAADIFIPGVTPPRLDVHRETFGFEKTFFDGAASIGLRVPFFQNNGAEPFSSNDLGDMTIILKGLLYQNPATDSGFSAGLAVTVPTGPDIRTATGELHSTILQPFLGYQLGMDRLLVYGFLSIAVPTEVDDVTFLFNDLGIGYRLCEGRGGLVSGIIPAIEAHVTTPLNHRDSNDTIQGFDLVVLTGGVHVGLGQRSMLTLGVATPVTGPRLFDVEAIVQFNMRF